MQNLKATGASAGGSGGKNLRNLFWQIVCDPISRIYSFCFLLSIFLLHCMSFDFLYAKIIFLTWLNSLVVANF